MAGYARAALSLGEKSLVPLAIAWGEMWAVRPGLGRTPPAAIGLPDTLISAIRPCSESVGSGATWFVTQTAKMSCIGPFGSLLALPILSIRHLIAEFRLLRKLSHNLIQKTKRPFRVRFR